MQTEICRQLGIEFPIFAFTHCRDVVAAVSQAGGLGVLGAVGFSPEQLEIECNWIDEHVGDKPYAVDLVIPQKYEGMGELDPVKLEEQLRAAIPPQHREFASKLLADHGVPEIPPEEQHHELLGMSLATAAPQLEVALQHDKVRVIANALGTPPPEVVDQVKASGRMIGALCGKVHQAVRHKEAGLDFIIAQGTEGGGHTGEIGSMVRVE
jgi:NAD(P)H-dependent flavin oxidoreductase YrpB (nitropropane dioxygenase family)